MPFLTTRRTLIGSVALLLATGLGAAQASETLRLKFGVYSSNKPSAMVKSFKPTLNELEQRMSVKLGKDVDIRLQIAKDYDEGITDLTDGRVDFSRFGPSSYVEARRANPDINILAMEKRDGERVFYGIIAVHRDSDIQSIEQLAGRSFAFGDEGSTIGRYLSQLFLKENGIRVGDLADYDYLGRHDKVGTAVAAGAFDAGALNESTFKKLVNNGAEIRELARFPNVTKPWIARAGLDPQIYAALKASLLEVTDQAALKGLKADGFLESSDEDYAVIRTAMEHNYEFFVDSGTSGSMPPMGAAMAGTDPGEVDQAQRNEQTTRSGLAAGAARPGSHVTINLNIPRSALERAAQRDGPYVLTINLSLPELSDPGSVDVDWQATSVTTDAAAQ